mgnify:CR=1 FL=1
MLKILQSKNKILRKKAALVDQSDIGTKKIDRILSAMSQLLSKEADGVAIAAPQIGVTLRIFIISARIFGLGKDENRNKKLSGNLVFINPKIIRRSKKTVWLDEGCLSVRWQYGKVRRPAKATVEALDKNGQPFTWNGSGLMAQVFQHEIDHLDGILFTDKAKNLYALKPSDLYGKK